MNPKSEICIPSRTTSRAASRMISSAFLLLLLTMVGIAQSQQSSTSSGASVPPAKSSKQVPATQPASPASSQSTQPLRSTTRLVQVSVVVHDRHGNPITRLSKSDFTVLDNKRQQTIEVFLTRMSAPRGHSPASLPPD